MAAPFSRLQLAAALLEYDNDPENPDAPNRDAKQSAIFAHLRPGYNLRPNPAARKSSDYLGVTLPSEAGSGGVPSGRMSAMSAGRRSRTSRASIDALRNPFGPDESVISENESSEEEEAELDFSSWGLEAYMNEGERDKDKPKDKKGKGKAKTQSLLGLQTSGVEDDTGSVGKRKRTRSLGDYDQLTETLDGRRNSFASPLDLVGKDPISLDGLRGPSDAIAETSTSRPQSALGIPFPTSGDSERSASPMPHSEFDRRLSATTSLLNSQPHHGRTQSTTSMGSENLLAYDAPRHSRALSNASMNTMLLNDDNPFALRAPSVMSRFDPKGAAIAAHERTMSTASFNPSINPSMMTSGASIMTAGPTEQRKPSTMEMLRPTVLVMPSPLQSAAKPPMPTSNSVAKLGFQSSSDGPPLPPGARTSRPVSRADGLSAPEVVASNSFTPNPRMSLSLSQLTFRNTLLVDGQRDAAYTDLGLPSADAEGEQAMLTPADPEEADSPSRQLSSEPARPAGKLFGKSLIDDLESRKANMRSKQRVFAGDQRPSMMNRGPRRSSTLIDPASLQQRPDPQRMSSFGSAGLGRRPSQIKPLLNFDNNEETNGSSRLSSGHLGNLQNGAATRSVFGVDTLWEREMAKLKIIEAQEEEDRRKQEAENAIKEATKAGKKGRKGGKTREPVMESPTPEPVVEPTPRVSAAPPTLPVFESTLKGPSNAVNADDESSSDSDPGDIPARQNKDSGAGLWSAGSSDEEDNGIRRVTGLGPPRKTGADSDEDDLPLSATVTRALSRVNALESDEEEDQPLSTLMNNKPSLPSINFDNLLDSKPSNDAESDEDNQPLGLRASRMVSTSNFSASATSPNGGDEDDLPLGLHPAEQQRRSQYQMMNIMAQQQQQQQQQMMMQAQMQSQMFLNPPSMHMSGFFAPPSMMGPVQPPMIVPTPPPAHDASKFGRVDRWRRDVAVEGTE